MALPFRRCIPALLLLFAGTAAGAQEAGLLGHWKLDEEAGPDFQDSSTTANAGSQVGYAYPSTDAAPMPAGNVRSLSFDGGGSLEVSPDPYAAITGSFTMAFWANPAGLRNETTEENAGDSGSFAQQYAIFPTHGDIFYGAGHAGAGVSVGVNGISVFEHAHNHLPATLVYTADLAGWTHVAVVYRNGGVNLYVNGAWVKSGLDSVMIVHPSAGMGGSVGYWLNYGPYHGGLDDVRIYDHALSDAEVRALSASPVAPSPSPTSAPGSSSASGGGGGGGGGGGCGGAATGGFFAAALSGLIAALLPRGR